MTPNTGMEAQMLPKLRTDAERLEFAADMGVLGSNGTDTLRKIAANVTKAADLIERLTSGIDREAVARIIDPDTWGYADWRKETKRGLVDCSASLAKADAIIALIAAAPSSQDAAHPQPEESNASHR